MTAEIGPSELRQAFESGERELCVDFGTETLTVKDAMEVFGLVRNVDGALIPRTGAANLRNRMGEQR